MTLPRLETAPWLRSVAYSVPKLGRDPADNEDSVAVDPSAGRFAVADGASTTARPDVWSRLLVEAFVSEQVDPLSPEVLARVRSQWTILVSAPNLPWYAQAKLQQGAGSTFLGLYVDTATDSYRAVGVGDSCLFHVRGHQALLIGPIDHVDQFSNFPELVSSRMDAPPQKAVVLAGEYRRGDVFLLATDAIAQFLLTVHELYHRVPPLETLTRSREHFARSVARYRQRGRIANDDVTLCVVHT